MDYAYEFSMVKDKATLDSAPLAGISAFVGDTALAGQFVTYDKFSKYVLASTDFTYGTTEPTRIIGQVSKVTVFVDPATGEVKNTHNNLEYTTNVTPNDNNPLNVMPGSRTNGMPAKMYYANAYGLISFACQTR